MDSRHNTDVRLGETGVSEHKETIYPANVISGSELRQPRTVAEQRLLLKADSVILPVCALTWWVTYLV